MAAAYYLYRALLPAAYSDFKPRSDKWDLDLSREPVVFTLHLDSGQKVRCYYLKLENESTTVVAAFHGNIRASGAMMTDFWSMFSDVHLILVNRPGYGTLPDPAYDRSDPLEWKSGLSQALKDVARKVSDFLMSDTIDWMSLRSKRVNKDESGIFTFDTARQLPTSFKDMRILVFGRSIGAFVASYVNKQGRTAIFYAPFQSVALLTPPLPSLLWGCLRGLLGYWFADLTTEISQDDYVISMEKEDLVGKLRPKVNNNYIIPGEGHRGLPDDDCRTFIREILARASNRRAPGRCRARIDCVGVKEYLVASLRNR